MIEETSGIGWRFVPEENALHLIFEVSGVAEDDDGKPCLCGAIIRISRTKGPLKCPPAQAAETAIKALVETGIMEAGIKPGQLTPITWEKFQAEGYEE